MMHQKEIFKKIGAIVAEINEQYQYLSDNPEQLNDLELELFSANADFLAEHVKVLKKINLKAEKNAQSDSVQQPAEEFAVNKPLQPITPVYTLHEPINVPAEEEVEIAPIEEESSAFQVVAEQPAEATTFSTPEAIVSVDIPYQVESIEQSIKTEATESGKQETETVPKPIAAEKFVYETSEPQPVVQTLNDLISAQIAQTNNAESNYNKQPINDLKSAISLNDKLLFIKDLFNGYSLAYSEAIDLLNRFDSFEVAETFLKANYATKNNWPAKQNTVDKFYEFLNRRYSK